MKVLVVSADFLLMLHRRVNTNQYIGISLVSKGACQTSRSVGIADPALVCTTDKTLELKCLMKLSTKYCLK